MPQALITPLLMLAFGQLFRRLAVLPDNAAEVLNAFVLYLCLPALVLSVVPNLELDRSLFALVLLAWLVMGFCLLGVRLTSRACGFAREVEGCLMLVAVLGNTAFLGYPLVRAWLGEDALPHAVVYDQLGSFIALPILGLLIPAHYGRGARVGVAELGMRILRFPAFLALLLALLPWSQPAPLQLVIREIAGLLVPLAMFAIGLNLKFTPAPGQAWPLVLGLTIKMLLGPLFAYALALLLLEPAQRSVAVLEAAMPPMVTAAAMAASAQLAPRLAAAMAGYGILVALLWIPLLAHWLRA